MNQPTDRVVYVIDDDEAVRDSLRALVESAGWTVEAFPSGEAFLDGFRPHGSSCIVTDVRMAGMSGIDLLARLRERGVAMPVVVITGHGDIPLAVTAMKRGALDFIEKPFSNDRILNAIKDAFAQSPAAPTGEQATAKSLVERLTAREREVFEWVASGFANKQIALQLNISPRTVEIHRARVVEKLGAQSVSHLVRVALAAGIALRDE